MLHQAPEQQLRSGYAGCNRARHNLASSRCCVAPPAATSLQSGGAGGSLFGPQSSGWLERSRRDEALETVQFVKVVFRLQLQADFGEGLRLIGGHELLGGWSLQRSLPMRWTPGDVWRTEAVELPVDGVFVYKYVRCAEGDAARPLSWQSGNNQVLTLLPADAPLLEVQDNWRGDPACASTSAPDGSRRMQLEERLVARVRETDKALREAQSQISALTEELRHAKLQAKALREEARLGANVRLALKDQLRAEKRRSSLLVEQLSSGLEEAAALGAGEEH
jgi:hypothetical protein